MLLLIAALTASETEAAPVEGRWITAPPEVVGVLTFVLFMVLLLVVTRFNRDR